MTAELTEHTGEIRGVNVRWVNVMVEGHTVEQVLSFDVTEAESVHGRPFDGELDRHIQMGMFAMDRISADGTMHKVASATSYVLDGKCIRTAKIEHCKEIEPMSSGWRITRPDGSEVQREPWSCAPGTPPTSHRNLGRGDTVTHFLRGVVKRIKNGLEDDELRPDKESGRAGSLGDGYRSYHLWYSRPPWSNWEMSYRVNLRRRSVTEDNPGAPWQAHVGLTYLKDKNEGLERWLKDLSVHDDQAARIDEVEDENGRVMARYSVIQVSHDSDALDESFASTLADTLVRFVEEITPAVEAFDLERRDRTDEVTHFLRGIGELVVGRLPDELKPDRDSGWADRSGDRRSYSLWYSRRPWRSDGLCYTINLFPRDGVVEWLRRDLGHLASEDVGGDPAWQAYVDFPYWACGSEESKSRVEGLSVYEDQTAHLGVISVSRPGDALDESFARTLADTLKRFIEVITPVVDDFENESSGDGDR